MEYPKMTRRGFIASGAAASVGVASELTGPGRTATAQSRRPKVIGCYTSVSDVLNNPRYIDALQKKLGVNAVICGSGINTPQWIRDMNPANTRRSHREDDSDLNAAIEETHRRGMEFWQWLPADHHYYREEGRHLMSETFEGVKFIDLPPVKYSLEYLNEASVCVAKPAFREYEVAYFGHAAKTYASDVVYSSHHRYANPSCWTNLFGCACSDCRREAAAMGYDFGKMERAMLGLRKNIRSLDPAALDRAAKFRMTFTDFLVLAGEDDSIMDWFVFRARVRGNQLKRLNETVHLMSGDRARFFVDTHPASLALLVGHNWQDFIDGASDAIFPLSWLGWHYMAPVAAWANQLCAWIPGLSETTALRLVYSFLGWDELGLPDESIAEVGIGESGAVHKTSGPVYDAFFSYFNKGLTEKLVTHEWTKLSVFNNGRLPAHPVIKAGAWPESICRSLMERADDLALTGYVFQGTESFIDKSLL